MLRKNKVERNLKSYIRGHLKSGYSRHAVRKVLISHGYDEPYVDKLLRKHSELQFVRKYAIFVSLLFVVSFALFNSFSPIQISSQEITGYAVSGTNGGCCTSICQQTSKEECYGAFMPGQKCKELEACRVGCCIDREGYCLTNYLYGNCIGSFGTSVNRDCSDIVFCRNLTDKSYASRIYNIKSKKGAGISAGQQAGYYKSSFSIKYYLYDKSNVLSVIAEIVDSGAIVDSLALYDDGFHNDGAKNDNLYGNNWQSSKIKDFEGFKSLDIDIVIVYKDGTNTKISKAQSIVIVGKSKCLPIYAEWGNTSKYGMIFAADNYNSSSGYGQLESDANSFIGALFSIGGFSGSKANFNFYRLEEALSYLNTQAIASIASSSCPSYSNTKDLIIVLDPKEEYCISENKKIIRTNPSVLFYSNITSADINKTLEDFCGYVLTPKKLADGIIGFATPPKIVMHTSDSITYNTTIVNLSFSISSVNYPVNYSIFLEDSFMSSGILNSDSDGSISLSLSNGTNQVLVSVADKNNNIAFAQLLLNVTA